MKECLSIIIMVWRADHASSFAPLLPQQQHQQQHQQHHRNKQASFIY
jgi:hypothetical protein